MRPFLEYFKKNKCELKIFSLYHRTITLFTINTKISNFLICKLTNLGDMK